MLADAVAALVEEDDDLAADVIQRDDDVDRLWTWSPESSEASFATRRPPTSSASPARICFDYQSAARQLERIGDHATKIAHLSLNFEEPVDGEIVEQQETEARAVVETAMERC